MVTAEDSEVVMEW